MAHFAKLGANGKVIAVLTLNNSDMLNASNVEDESVGQQYLERLASRKAEAGMTSRASGAMSELGGKS
jgi:hypothetical protein